MNDDLDEPQFEHEEPAAQKKKRTKRKRPRDDDNDDDDATPGAPPILEESDAAAAEPAPTAQKPPARVRRDRASLPSRATAVASPRGRPDSNR